MSIQALYTAATGMEALQSKLDVISNNLANVNTTAFKQDRANFEDLFYRNEVLPGSQDSNGNLTPTGIAFGTGAARRKHANRLYAGNASRPAIPTTWPFKERVSFK